MSTENNHKDSSNHTSSSSSSSSSSSTIKRKVKDGVNTSNHGGSETIEAKPSLLGLNNKVLLNTPPHSPSLERFSALSKPRESLLTSPEMANIQWGTFNYIALAYVMAGFSIMAQMYKEKGVIVDMELFWTLTKNWHCGLILSVGLFLFSQVNYIQTRLMVKGYIPNRISIVLYCLWQLVAFPVSMSYLFSYELSPILSGGYGLQLCVYSLKNHSYWHTNYFLKKGGVKATSNNSPVTRKDLIPNVSFSHFLYFMVAPTLVFETSFPKTKSIRPSYILKEVLAGFGTFFVFYLMLNLTTPFYRECGTESFLIILVQLSLPSMSLWMLGFYGVFHCLLNIFAEITKYADREFYQDWWNATTFDMWWRRWNKPVYRFMSRHVYTDSMHTIKLNKFWAMVSTFLLSALLHEIVMIISFRFVRPILSTTMLLQIGLVYFTQLPIFQKTRFGNVIMWITIN
ncbi:membrane bound O-acyl transferase family protein [Cavenderia fasciculata]|uniref:O-acyltransferase n=1 Tax=Cavenderia fasciculata TaxID=261658 RepID=F4QEV4_CACFS|nr:membrane bound O-acyl transferase family protein [Cavenderia fasciculata]EGG14161.1 membrane bound O-acyl transferase family protein [Cavenderia fasciculata]|eukprot:XP_004350869.1 membrane bound O-acyl transferase family protein [Cavenderia fasciculata]